MKLNKIFILATAALALTACSEDEEWNSTNDAVVAMGQQTLSVKESKGMFTVPITVTGERNAPVQVTVEVVAAETNGAVEDVNYIITSKTINISAEAEAGSVEIITVDDDGINDARVFTMNIIDVKGGKVAVDDQGNAVGASTEITLKDNDAAFYEKLGGKWTMTSVTSRGAAQQWNVTVTAFDEDSPYYDKYLVVTGLMGYSWAQMVMTYAFDKATMEGSLTIEMGQICATGVNFGLGGLNDVALYCVEDDYFTTTPIVGHWSEDFKTVTFQETPFIYGALLADGSLNGYTWFSMGSIQLTR